MKERLTDDEVRLTRANADAHDNEEYVDICDDLLATRAAHVALQAEVETIRESLGSSIEARDNEIATLRAGMPNASELEWLAGECDGVAAVATAHGRPDNAKRITGMAAWLRKLAGGAS